MNVKPVDVETIDAGAMLGGDGISYKYGFRSRIGMLHMARFSLFSRAALKQPPDPVDS